MNVRSHPRRQLRARRRSVILAGALLLPALTACGSQNAACPTGDLGGAKKPVEPVAEGIQARPPLEKPKPHEAIIHGVDADGKSTVLALHGGEKQVQVDALWVRLGSPGTPGYGGTSPVWIRTGVQDDRRVRVGMYEQYAGGMGPQWRAAVWLSSFLAATSLGKDLTDFRFTAEAGGMIDGASAGALMTTAFLASMLGQDLDAKATMTGTVNPDGTVGPVGGIPQKFEAAIAQGKTRLGYPVGLRFAPDVNTGKNVDLEELARAKGAVAVEIKDIREAYEFMTGGKKLPEPTPVDRREMEIEPEVRAQLDGYYDAWRKDLESEWARVIELLRAGRLTGGAYSLAAVAEQEGMAAERLRNQGLAPSAYARIVEAWTYAASATATVEILDKVKAGDLAGAEAILVQFAQLDAFTGQTLREIGALKPKTMGDHLRMMAAFELAITGWGFHTFGVDQLAQAAQTLRQMRGYTPEQLADPRMQEQVSRQIVPAIVSVARGIGHAKRAQQALQIDPKSINYMCSLPNARRLATSFSSAAAANLRYFESLIVTQIAEKERIPESVAKVMLMRYNPDYLISAMAFNLAELDRGLPKELRDEWGDKSLPWSLGTLAGGILSYFKASMLISKYYSLDVQLDYYTGRASGVRHEKAFKEMLTGAELKARQNAHAAKVAAGSIPVEARLAYQHASLLREGDVGDKLKALELYWESSVYSQTAVMLARN